MLKTSRIALFLGLSGAASLACGGLTDDENADGGNLDGGATADAKPADSLGDTPAALPNKYVIIYDDTLPNCMTSGPGTDLDAIELKRGGVVIGVGKTGSSSYSVGGSALGSTPCAPMTCGAAGTAACTYAEAALRPNIEGVADGEVKAVGMDVGYFSLNGGSIAIEIGDVTGAGAGQEIKSGDTLHVYEVDLYYKSRSALTPPKAYDMCICAPDKYDIYVSPTLDSKDFKKLSASAYQVENTAACGAVSSASSGCGTTDFVIP